MHTFCSYSIVSPAWSLINRRGAINSWFFNHKSEFLFYETYLNQSSCKRLDFIPRCDSLMVKSGDGAARHHVISIVDGYGFEISTGLYCKIVNSQVIEQQVR
jgi:hypothetical protein